MENIWTKILGLITNEKFWLLVIPVINFITVYLFGVDVSEGALLILNGAFAVGAGIVIIINGFKKDVK
jgi:hypothetical protein